MPAAPEIEPNSNPSAVSQPTPKAGTVPFIEQPPRLCYSMREAAALLGVSYVSVHRLTKRGLLKPSRALRTPIFSRAELERFLAETTC